MSFKLHFLDSRSHVHSPRKIKEIHLTLLPHFLARGPTRVHRIVPGAVHVGESDISQLCSVSMSSTRLVVLVLWSWWTSPPPHNESRSDRAAHHWFLYRFTSSPANNSIPNILNIHNSRFSWFSKVEVKWASSAAHIWFFYCIGELFPDHGYQLLITLHALITSFGVWLTF